MDHFTYGIEFISAQILRGMAKFRYWKLTIEEIEKVTHDENKVLNWDIKCTKEPEEDAVFFGVFLYKEYIVGFSLVGAGFIAVAWTFNALRGRI